MAKRISSLLLIIFLGVCLASCSNRQILLFLNWGEYIDESLIEAFEEKENCTVVMDLGESNEIFYSKYMMLYAQVIIWLKSFIIMICY